jgi:hypothetical protein
VSAAAQGELHRLAEDESLDEVARRYLGTGAAVSELRRFNGLSKDEDGSAGLILAIPGPERQRARERILQAEQMVQAAKEAQAPTYAEAKFGAARQWAESARAALDNTSYSQAEAQSDLAAWYAGEAIQEADRRAREQRPGRLVEASGDIRSTLSQGVRWASVEPGASLPEQSWLRSGSRGRCLIDLDDGSRWRVSPNTTVGIRRYVVDRRTGQVEYSLGLNGGRISGKVPNGRGGDQRSILVGNTVVSLSGAASIWLEARSEGGVAISVYAGQAELTTNGRPALLSSGQGGAIGPDGVLTSASLLKAPRLAPVGGPSGKTARQVVPLSWIAPASPKPVTFQVELGRGEPFLELLDTRMLSSTGAETETLTEGEYVWRVIPYNHLGVAGMVSDSNRFRVEKFMEIEMVADGPFQQFGDQWVGGAKTRFRARPTRLDHSLVGFQYSLNGASFQRAPAEIGLEQSGEYRLVMRGVAADSDTGPMAEKRFIIDADPPSVALDISAPFEVPGGGRMVRAEVMAEDRHGIEEILIGIDDEAMAPYGGPVQLPAEAEVLFRFTARDLLQNASPVMSLRVQGNEASR